LAEDRGPDIFSIPSSWLTEYQNKITPLPSKLSIIYPVTKGTLNKTVVNELITNPSLSLKDLKNNFVDKNKLTDKDLFYGSLKGMAAAAGDPYTVFMDPKEAKDFADGLAGTFEGIGAEVGLRSDIITVIAPLDGMPAQKAGIMAGDKIYAIDGKSTLGLTIDQAVKAIRGPKDTKVTLTIIRGKDKPKDITIVRQVVIVKSVKTEIRPDGIMVITVSNFNDDTAGLFDQAVNLALTKKPKGIILDLRNDPGGYLDTAVSLASEWIDSSR